MSNYVWGNDTQFFFKLTPDIVLESVENLGIATTGRCLQLGSMENRVYEIEVERPEYEIKSPSDKFIVAKFYRPGRWTKEQILEEHEFLFDLLENEISVIAPIKVSGESLFKLKDQNIFYTIFPKKGGRAPDEFDEDQLEILGRTIARIHNIGASKKAAHRLPINVDTFGKQNLEFLVSSNIIPNDYRESYISSVKRICKKISPYFENKNIIRIHGDCHKGNIIYRDDTPHFIDFDDMLIGPAVQDIWLIIPGIEQRDIQDREILLEAYTTMRNFNFEELKLIEPLRSLRYIHFSAWITKRWEDPIFKENFPFFNTDEYWREQVFDLNTQYDKIPTLEVEKNKFYSIEDEDELFNGNK